MNRSKVINLLNQFMLFISALVSLSLSGEFLILFWICAVWFAPPLWTMHVLNKFAMNLSLCNSCKVIVAKERPHISKHVPPELYWLLDSKGFSMPSIHTAMALLFAMELFTFQRAVIVGTCVGITRIYLGVHTVKDVLVGLIIGWSSHHSLFQPNIQYLFLLVCWFFDGNQGSHFRETLLISTFNYLVLVFPGWQSAYLKSISHYFIWMCVICSIMMKSIKNKNIIESTLLTSLATTITLVVR